MKKVFKTIPKKIIYDLMYHIKHNSQLDISTIRILLKYYPNSLKRNITCYRVIGRELSDDIPSIGIKRDKCWTTNKHYKFLSYLEANDLYFKFEAQIDGFCFKDVLSDCKFHDDPIIKDLERFVKEKEIFALKIISHKFLEMLNDETLNEIITPPLLSSNIQSLIEVDGIKL